MALTWDRADIAQEEIFREDVIWRPGEFSLLLSILILDGFNFSHETTVKVYVFSYAGLNTYEQM